MIDAVQQITAVQGENPVATGCQIVNARIKNILRKQEAPVVISVKRIITLGIIDPAVSLAAVR